MSRQDRLDKYVAGVIDSSPELQELLRQAQHDIIIWGEVSPKTKAMQERVIASLQSSRT